MLSIVFSYLLKGFPELQCLSFEAYKILEFSNKWSELRRALLLMDSLLILIANIQELAITGFASQRSDYLPQF